MERLGVELVEQPFKARMLPQLRWLRERSSLPIMADESAVFEADLAMLDGVVDADDVARLVECETGCEFPGDAETVVGRDVRAGLPGLHDAVERGAR